MKKQAKETLAIGWIDLKVFPVTIMLSCGFSYDEIFKQLKGKKDLGGWLTALQDDKDLIDNGHYLALRRAYTNTGKDKIVNFYIIIRPAFTFTDYEFVKLAHEVVHICQFMLPDFLDRDKEHECEAYVHTAIMNECLEILRGKKR